MEAAAPRRPSMLSVMSDAHLKEQHSSSTSATPKSSGRFAVYSLAGDSDAPRSFIEAAERGDTSYVIKQIERTLDFDINQVDRHARTALHWAAESGHVETARTLLDFGATLRAQDCMGRTAVHMAARAAGREMLEALLGGLGDAERAVAINEPDKSGVTAVFSAFQRGDEGRDAFEWLLTHGARWSAQQEEQAHGGLLGRIGSLAAGVVPAGAGAGASACGGR